MQDNNKIIREPTLALINTVQKSVLHEEEIDRNQKHGASVNKGLCFVAL